MSDTNGTNHKETRVPSTAFTPETARAAGLKSAEARRRRKDPDDKAKGALLDGAADAAKVLVAVAGAKEGFEDVKPELRLKAALVVLEYVLGKPRGLVPDGTGDEPSEQAPADAFAALLEERS